MYNTWQISQNVEHHNKRFDQAGFGASDLLLKTTSLVSVLCVLVIISKKSVIGACSILASVQFIHLMSSKFGIKFFSKK